MKTAVQAAISTVTLDAGLSNSGQSTPAISTPDISATRLPDSPHQPVRISAQQAAGQSNQWADIQVATDEGSDRLVWLEFDAGTGRNQLRCRDGDARSRVLTPAGYSVRSRVHEYGGGSYRLVDGGLVFVNDTDQGLYWHSFDSPQTVIRVYQRDGYRYGDLQFDRCRNRIIAVEEQHCDDDSVCNRLVAIELVLDGRKPGRKILVQGDDFYSAPRLSRTADQLAWVSWNHPHQPWDSTRLWLGTLDVDGVPQGQSAITGGQYQGHHESVLQPEFDPDGSLYFLSDRSGWWNLYRYSVLAGIESLMPRQAEFCRAPWPLGQQAYVVLAHNRIGCSWWRNGRADLGILDLSEQHVVSVGAWAAVHGLAGQGDWLLAIAESSAEPGRLVRCSVTDRSLKMLEQLSTGDDTVQTSVQNTAQTSVLPPVVEPTHIEIDSQSGQPVYGLLYRPNADSNQQLPLIIQLHGGPTAQADGRYDPLKQYWLQRGFALLDLNYRGSSGYGRAYRQSLQGRWGISDAEDVIDAARFMIGQGWVDPDKVVVRGNSAGGYTTLQVLSHPSGQQWIRAGASHYGISDLEQLAGETHKFESRYLDWLIGDRQLNRQDYRQRSPIHRPQQFSRPVIFFQGGLDRVVPATQTYRLYNQLKGLGLAVEYLAFANERHGFRQAKNRACVLEREWRFYRRELGLVDSPTAMAFEHADEPRDYV